MSAPVSAYRWRAATADGRVVVGELQAPDRAGAVDELRRRGLVPLDVDAASTARAGVGRARRGAATVAFTRALAALLRAGVPLDRALRFAADQAAHPSVAEAADAVRRDVQAGAGLAESLGRHPAVFGRLYVATVAAGEEAGALAPAAERLADYLDEDAELRAQIRGALLYPAIMGVVAGVGVLVLMLAVVPRFVALLGETGGALPLSTRALVAVSRALIGWWWVWLALLVGGAAWARAWLATSANRARFDAARLRWPVVGPLERALAAARVTRTLGLLLRAGTRVVPALRIAAAAAPNRALATGVERAAVDVGRGERVAAALAPVLPPLAAQLVAAGEESGRLDELCLRAADTYDAEVRRALRTAVGLVEPALIVLFGAVVGFVALAMLQAVYSINVGGL
ncbi:Type II secretion system F domain-containing protein [Gemmatirosa kalamazoonensis]|uniref:General secretion pathway protein F n=1 Tax=Gemmatirosa kalamazoonensis TaxID=861299 RepID=W0RLH8_9BACT|nr:type II secretion system F family protein [Gemmatirosa kalamazoonensis]AHG91939.1 Type II secretion system F domain-containing protein [Gemmatirosa kalamazoonensis]